MADNDRVRVTFSLDVLVSSDSSMADNDSLNILYVPTSKNVQIPLWPIMTYESCIDSFDSNRFRFLYGR